MPLFREAQEQAVPVPAVPRQGQEDARDHVLSGHQQVLHDGHLLHAWEHVRLMLGNT